jgi:hypothetical protein
MDYFGKKGISGIESLVVNYESSIANCNAIAITNKYCRLLCSGKPLSA